MNSVSQLPWAAYAQLSAAIEMWAIKQVLHILEQILSRCAEWSTPWAVFYTLNICVRQRLNLEPGSSCRGVYCSHTSNTAAACARGYYAGPFPCHVDKLLFCQSRIRALHEMENQPLIMHFQHCSQVQSCRLCPPSPHRSPVTTQRGNSGSMLPKWDLINLQTLI